MILEIFLVVLVLFLLIYRYTTKQFGKWESLGVPCVPGRFPGGSHNELVLSSKAFNDMVKEDYFKFKDYDYYGTYLFGKPVLNINNMELIREVLVKNFNSFVDRNDINIERAQDGGAMDQLWRKQLTALSGDAWKDVRSTFSPIFTSGKMRGMLKFIVEVGGSLNTEFGALADSGEDFELKDVFGKFSLDSLATCAFGMNPNSFKDGQTVFVKNAARIFKNTTLDQIMVVSRLIPGMQKIQKMLGINIFKPKETMFFRDIIRNVIKHRRESGQRKNDLVDLMVDCMKNEAVHEKETDIDQYHQDMKFAHESKENITEDTIVATALILLVAGYDTTGMALSFLAYQMAKNPDIQSKLQEEIDQAYEDNDGKLPDYTVIQGLPYLDMCIYETLRIHTSIGMLFRCCTQDTKIAGLDIKVNDFVAIPSVGIHHDEKYYPNPDQFNPENFSKEARQERNPYTFLAFGQGPRACIGMRFAMLEAKVAVLQVFREFTFLPSEKNPDVLELDPQSQVGYIKNGIHSRVKRREV